MSNSTSGGVVSMGRRFFRLAACGVRPHRGLATELRSYLFRVKT
jgi:hypothetical protein